MILAACIIAAAILLQPFVLPLWYWRPFSKAPQPLPILSEEELESFRKKAEEQEGLMKDYLKTAIEHLKREGGGKPPWEQ